MENKKKSKMYIVWIAAIGVFAMFFLIGIFGSDSSSENDFNPDHTPVTRNSAPENTQQPVISSNPNFNEINQNDQARIKEIVTGVMQNTISVTPEVKKELRAIFVKYNATQTEIDNFVSYGPALVAVYQAYYFFDASQAVSNGIPVKSDARLNFEKEALSRGLITSERIKANDEEMRLIASHQPVLVSDGRQVIFTADLIQSTLDNISLITTRLQSLLE